MDQGRIARYSLENREYGRLRRSPSGRFLAVSKLAFALSAQSGTEYVIVLLELHGEQTSVD